MNELEEKLNAVLSDPGEMSRLAQMASRLMGGAQPESEAPPDNEGGSGDALAGLLSRAMGGMGSGKEKTLLEGVSAYLDTDRQNRLKRAMRLASAARAAGFAFREMGGV